MSEQDLRCRTWNLVINITYPRHKTATRKQRKEWKKNCVQSYISTEEQCLNFKHDGVPYCKWSQASMGCRVVERIKKRETVQMERTLERKLDTGRVTFSEGLENLSLSFTPVKNRKCLGNDKPDLKPIFPLSEFSVDNFNWNENLILNFKEACKEFIVDVNVYNLDGAALGKYTWENLVSLGNQTLPKAENGTLKFTLEENHLRNCRNLTMLRLDCFTPDDEKTTFDIEGLQIHSKEIEKFERCKATPYLKLKTTSKVRSTNFLIEVTESMKRRKGRGSLLFTPDGNLFEDSTLIPLLVGSIISGLIILLGATGKVKPCES